jgi:hypothetical protein
VPARILHPVVPKALVCETNVQSYALPLMQALLG